MRDRRIWIRVALIGVAALVAVIVVVRYAPIPVGGRACDEWWMAVGNSCINLARAPVSQACPEDLLAYAKRTEHADCQYARPKGHEDVLLVICPEGQAGWALGKSRDACIAYVRAVAARGK